MSAGDGSGERGKPDPAVSISAQLADSELDMIAADAEGLRLAVALVLADDTIEESCV
jgi:hypothetical protein